MDWLLVVDDEEAVDEIILGFQGLVDEGTQVTLMAKNPKGTFNILSSQADVEGVVR